MAEMDLWLSNSKVSNFTDNRQSLIISDNIEEALKIATKEASYIRDQFFNNLTYDS